MYLNKILILVTFLLLTISSNAEEIKSNDLNTEFNVYTGMFDFSDDGKKINFIRFSTSK
jgi:lipid A 3-O-deacylase